jgi:hypothetical protein
VNVSVLSVDEAITVVGETVIVPEPFAAYTVVAGVLVAVASVLLLSVAVRV